MSVLPTGLTCGGSGAIDSGDMTNSLRFRSSASAYLSRTPVITGNRKTWTWSGWVKRGTLSSGQQNLFATTGLNNDGQNRSILYIDSSDNVTFLNAVSNAYRGAGSYAKLRDPASWYHIVLAIDTTQATESNRLKLYINGTLQTNLFSGSAGFLSLNEVTNVNSTYAHRLGAEVFTGANYLDGYLARVAFVDGQALTPDSFGYTNSIGVWTTKSKSAVKAVVDAGGTNSFMLEFDDATSLTTLGYDASTKGNNWTCTNISLTAGVTYDSMVDVPGNSYCTTNPLVYEAYPLIYSEGNLKLQGPTTNGQAGYWYGTVHTGLGKWYFEYINITNSTPGWNTLIAVAGSTSGLVYGWTNYYNLGNKSFLILDSVSGAQGSASSLANGDIVGIALDTEANTISFYKNGALAYGPYTTASDSSFQVLGYIQTTSGGSRPITGVNFGQRPFAYTPPSGYLALCQANLPDPTIANPAEHFDVVLDTGANIKTAAQALFTDELAWVKDRANANNHQLMDSVRGVDAVLQSNTTSAETTYSAPSGTSVGWAWKAGYASVSNTAGTITSTVSANTTAGFSIVTYTGTGTNATVGHGLGVAPKMVIVKQRSTGTTENWAVYHASVATDAQTDYLLLNSAAQVADLNTYWNDTAPTSTVFSIGTVADTNESTKDFVAYCFAEIQGYSKFGLYTGNGGANGPFVYCGFRPAFVMVKMSSSTGSWVMFDANREGYNVDNDPVWADATTAEGTTDLIDIVSNGFKVRSTDASVNTNTGAYLYVAFAEHPFKYANAR